MATRSSAKRRWLFLLLFAGVFIIAAVLRVPQLEKRPMHTDEAVHADKFGTLLEKGIYEYDPNEYHGPTLNYSTLIPAWLSSAEDLSQVDEFTLRIIPVFFGLGLIVLLAGLSDGLGRAAVVMAGVLTAVSPAMVFYSRYYIQEMLLVFFSFGLIVAGWRYYRRPRIAWAVIGGACLGLMHATKETFLIAVAAMGVGAMFLLWAGSNRGERCDTLRRHVRLSHVLLLILAALAVSVVFFSSFFTNWRGIGDSVLTYTTYLDRAGGDNQHEHPWYYYLSMLGFSRYADGPVWSEALILILAAAGLVFSVKRPRFLQANYGLVRFLALYTVIMVVVYSAIPYKTPWCMLGFLHGMVLLAGIGAVGLVRLMPHVLPRLIILAFIVEGVLYLGWQAYAGSYIYECDSRNPYVYAHTTDEVFALVDRVDAVAAVHGDGRNMRIQVISPAGDYWPLPWYLREYPNVWWWSDVQNDVPSAPLIIASPAVEEALVRKLYKLTPFEERQMYMYLFDEPYYFWLRPNVKLFGYVRRDIHQKLSQ